MNITWVRQYRKIDLTSKIILLCIMQEISSGMFKVKVFFHLLQRSVLVLSNFQQGVYSLCTTLAFTSAQLSSSSLDINPLQQCLLQPHKQMAPSAHHLSKAQVSCAAAGNYHPIIIMSYSSQRKAERRGTIFASSLCKPGHNMALQK